MAAMVATTTATFTSSSRPYPVLGERVEGADLDPREDERH